MMRFTNPIFAGDYPDPSVLRVGDDFYATNSCFNWAPGLLIWHSKDMVNWKPLTFASPDYFGDIWAPELVYHNGKFFLYFFCNYPQSGNFVIEADKIEGPWSKPIKLEVGWIDPGHAVGPDGRRYIHVSEGMVVEVDASGTKVISKPTKSYEGWPVPQDWRIEGFCLEGPKVLQKGGWYYMVAAEGGTAGPATSHMVVVARSKTPVGPWENSPYNPLVHTASREEKWHSAGHGTLVEAPDGRWWVMYHGYLKGYVSLGRQTLVRPVVWTEDGWPVLAPFEEGGECPGTNVDLSDDFRDPQLKWIWRFWGEHDRSRYQIGGGKLTLKAKGTSAANCSPMAAICGWPAYSVSVKLKRSSDAAMGGLYLFYNEKAYIGWLFGPRGAGYHLMTHDPFHWFEPGSREIELKLVNDHHELDFCYRTPGGQWRNIQCSREVSGFQHNTFGGFLSLRPALCAFGEGEIEFSDWRIERL